MAGRSRTARPSTTSTSINAGPPPCTLSHSPRSPASTSSAVTTGCPTPQPCGPTPSGDSERSVLPIAGDDADAKKEVTDLLDRLGYDAYDVGPLAEGCRDQRDTAAYASLYNAEGPD